jgi:hypothetical protein
LKSWGGSVAVGHGVNWILRPDGLTYYPDPVPIELRGYDLGRCSPRGRLAYTRLVVREPLRPARWIVGSLSAHGSTGAAFRIPTPAV